MPSESSESSEYPTCCSSSPGCQQDACPGSSWWDAWMHQASETEHYLFLSIYTYIIIYQYISIYIYIYQLYLCLSLSSKRFFSALKTPLETAESFLEIWQKNSPQCLLDSACALLALLNLRQSHVPGTVSSSGHGMCQRSPLRSHSSGSSRSLS